MLCQSNSNKIILHILPVWFRFDIQPKLRLIWEQVSPLYPGAMFVTLQYQLQWTETWDLHRLSAKFSDISHSPRELPQEWVVWLPVRILSLGLISSQDWQVLTRRRSSMRCQRYWDWDSQHWRADWGHLQLQHLSLVPPHTNTNTCRDTTILSSPLPLSPQLTLSRYVR